MTDKERQELVDWIIGRLVDNYEWQDVIEYDDWLRIQDTLVFAIMGSSQARIDQLIEICEEHGVIEEEGF